MSSKLVFLKSFSTSSTALTASNDHAALVLLVSMSAVSISSRLRTLMQQKVSSFFNCKEDQQQEFIYAVTNKICTTRRGAGLMLGV
jgi:hypothetical protein